MIGIELPHVTSSDELHRHLPQLCDFSFVVCGVSSGSAQGKEAFAPEELIALQHTTQTSATKGGLQVVGRLQPVDLETSRTRATQLFERELQWAVFVGLPAVVVDFSPSVDFIRTLNAKVDALPFTSLWVRINPLTAAATSAWVHWNRLKMLSRHNPKLQLALELGPAFTAISAHDLQQWASEPLKCLIIPSDLFEWNKKRYPVLSKHLQSIVHFFLKFKCFIVVKITRDNVAPSLYYDYLSHLKTTLPVASVTEEACSDYFDRLQHPLQPLRDNLESQTYEIFENDHVKYIQYERAVHAALMDRSDAVTTVIMVCGAGRGPLVDRCINASVSSQRPVRIYAIEKNPNAIVILRQKSLGWKSQVDIVHTDMRSFNPAEKADIIVTELLGSFGCNELSPECLDGALVHLKPTGISIPHSYTSWCAPLSACKVWNDCDAFKTTQAFETPYVVMFKNHMLLADPKPLWTFTHSFANVQGTERYAHASFDISRDALIHGIAGYFTCVLYGSVTMNIVPNCHTDNMMSWFPIYFPIKNPVCVDAGDTVDIDFWRCGGNGKVWYEWTVGGSDIHNVNGKSYAMYLS